MSYKNDYAQRSRILKSLSLIKHMVAIPGVLISP